jgi:hypothetical protein
MANVQNCELYAFATNLYILFTHSSDKFMQVLVTISVLNLQKVCYSGINFRD